MRSCPQLVVVEEELHFLEVEMQHLLEVDVVVLGHLAVVASTAV